MALSKELKVIVEAHLNKGLEKVKIKVSVWTPLNL
jgi:hypothetical protein